MRKWPIIETGVLADSPTAGEWQRQGCRQTPFVARPDLSLNALDDSTPESSVSAQVRTEHRRGQQRTDGLAENPQARPQDEGWPGSHSQLPGTDLIGQLQGYVFSSQLLK